MSAPNADFAIIQRQHCGPFETSTRCAKHQPECDCGKPSEIIYKDNVRDSDTWFYRECEDCLRHLCETCGDREPDSLCDDCANERVRNAEEG